ncbi:hypothetical protein [Sorangium sp. So ce388]|uniref:hypothetical protein n=1 Tax=Sorangium sp. So ce388 TaxID=3133309 RepID=UPI003F5C6FC6
MAESGLVGVATLSPDSPRVVGGGVRSYVAAGVVPREGRGVLGRLELSGSHDSERGTLWTGRLHGGYAWVPRISSPGPFPELGADIGSRFDGGIFQNGLEWGVRGALVWRITPPRMLPEENQAFVMIGRGWDLSVMFRAGESVYRSVHVADVSCGVALRVRAWSDLLWP